MSNAARFGRWGGLALGGLLAACSQSPDGASDPTGNTAPTIFGSPATSVMQGANYQFKPSAADVDGDALIFGIDAKPSWAVFNTSTGQLSGTPGAADVSVDRGIVIWVSDGKAQTPLPAFDLTVSATGGGANRAPTISGTAPTTVVAGATYTFTPTASDADGNTLTFTIRNKPSWATFSATTGQLQGVPQGANVGTFSDIGISASDGQVAVALSAFSIVVTPSTTNRAPAISGTPMATVAAGQAYAFVPTASDADGDALTFSIAGLPAWAAFDAAIGRVSGTPPSGTTGTFANIAISVSDGRLSASLAPFAITVTGPTTNHPPTISGTPSTSAPQGVQYAFQPTATDADADPLTFTIANRPAWATFNTTTGRLQGTPGTAGTFANIVISVSDGKATASLPAFQIVVTQSNRAPTISGTPATAVMQGTAYAFQPTANDADGDPLTFSITNKPSWATFSTATGLLQGTPGAGDVGTTSGIVINVSDGKAPSVALPAFSVTVQAVATGSATLTWTPPTTNNDGSALTDLAGYKIYWGTTQGSYSNSVTLTNPGLASYVVTNLVSGTYFFAATAYDTAGNESAFSNAASKTIL